VDKLIHIRDISFPEDYLPVRELWTLAEPGIYLHLSDEMQEIQKMILRHPDLFLQAEKEGQSVGARLGGLKSRRRMIYLHEHIKRR